MTPSSSTGAIDLLSSSGAINSHANNPNAMICSVEIHQLLLPRRYLQATATLMNATAQSSSSLNTALILSFCLERGGRLATSEDFPINTAALLHSSSSNSSSSSSDQLRPVPIHQTLSLPYTSKVKGGIRGGGGGGGKKETKDERGKGKGTEKGVSLILRQLHLTRLKEPSRGCYVKEEEIDAYLGIGRFFLPPLEFNHHLKDEEEEEEESSEESRSLPVSLLWEKEMTVPLDLSNGIAVHFTLRYHRVNQSIDEIQQQQHQHNPLTLSQLTDSSEDSLLGATFPPAPPLQIPSLKPSSSASSVPKMTTKTVLSPTSPSLYQNQKAGKRLSPWKSPNRPTTWPGDVSLADIPPFSSPPLSTTYPTYSSPALKDCGFGTTRLSSSEVSREKFSSLLSFTGLHLL